MTPIHGQLPPPHAARCRSRVMSDAGVEEESGNGTVCGFLARAAWVLRRAVSFEAAMWLACDVGDDVHAVACVTGGLAGASFGLQAIPVALGHTRQRQGRRPCLWSSRSSDLGAAIDRAPPRRPGRPCSPALTSPRFSNPSARSAVHGGGRRCLWIIAESSALRVRSPS
jgi:hypothetical protein